jgi:Glyoxalase/Bleomycin resistance protein/Dioxygenase superfamily
MTPRLAPVKVVQNCYIVRNLVQACERLHKLYGIGPFLGGNDFELGQHVYRGQAAPPIAARGVFVQSGDLNLELVELVSKTPSAFHDMFPNGQEGFHHVAMFCDDYEASRDAFVAQGLPVASEFTVPFGAKICYIDAREPMGHMLELYPESDIIRAMYRQTVEAAANWDRRQLIIPWNL